MGQVFRIRRGIGRRHITTQAVIPEDPPPSEGTPLQRQVHPRLFLTSEEIPTVADHMLANHESELDTLCGYLVNTSTIPNGDNAQPRLAGWGCFNASFLCLMHDALTARGYVFPAALDTKAKCAALAYNFVTSVSGQNWLANLRAGLGPPWNWGHIQGYYQEHGFMGASGIGYPGYIPLAVLWDWCKDHLTSAAQADCKATVEQLWALNYDADYDANPNRQYHPAYPNLALYQNQRIKHFEVYSYLAAFVGDVDSTISTKMDDVVNKAWDSMYREHRDFFTNGPFHLEAVGYHADDYIDILLPVQSLQTALGKNWFTDEPAYSKYHEMITGLAETNGAIASGTLKIGGRWGLAPSDGQDERIDILHIIGNQLAKAGQTQAAGVSKYVWANWAANQEGTSGVAKNSTLHKPVWGWAVRSLFLGSWSTVSPIDPHTVTALRAVKLGFNMYVFRSGHDAVSSEVQCWLPTMEKNGHMGIGFGRWDVYKTGNLILGNVGNAKSGLAQGEPGMPVTSSWYYSSGTFVRPHPGADGGSWPKRSGSGWFFAPNSAQIGRNLLRQMSDASVVRAEKYDAQDYGYCWGDYTLCYNGATHGCTGQSVEFVYIYGAEDHEYVLRFDRTVMTNTTNYRRTQVMWLQDSPTRIDGSYATDTSDIPPIGTSAPNYINRSRTKYTTSDGTKWALINQKASVSFGGCSTGDTDGKAFVTLVEKPASYTVTISGGDYVEYQEYDFSGYRPVVISPGYPSAVTNEWLGWGRLEITSASTEDPYLVALQLGKASTMGTQAPIVRIASTDGKFVGAHIQDTTNEYAVLFVRGYADANARLSAATVAISPATSTLKVLVMNMPSNTVRGAAFSNGNLTIGAPGAGATVVTTSQGVLELSISGGVVSSGV